MLGGGGAARGSGKSERAPLKSHGYAAGSGWVLLRYWSGSGMRAGKERCRATVHERALTYYARKMELLRHDGYPVMMMPLTQGERRGGKRFAYPYRSRRYKLHPYNWDSPPMSQFRDDTRLLPTNRRYLVLFAAYR